MSAAEWVAAIAFLGAAAPAFAAPPYLTDDPAPTETGHWEIYAFTAGDGHRSTADSDAGLDLNYGPVDAVQLTATLPLRFSHSREAGWRGGTGDVELGVKYRVFNDEKNGVRQQRAHLMKLTGKPFPPLNWCSGSPRSASCLRA